MCIRAVPPRVRRPCIAVFLAAACASRCQPNADEQRSKAVTARQAQGIIVDGLLSDQAWQAAAWYSSFTPPGIDSPASVQTRFAVAHDDAFLYLAAVADEPHVKAIKAMVTERDGKVFRDDCIEFMIDPTGDRVEYYHFAVSASGALYDAQRRQGGHVMSPEWSCSASSSASIGTASFAVELALPLVELGVTPRSAAQPWAIQVARERQAGGRPELSAYLRFGGSFHVPSTYAPLNLDGADLQRFLWDVKAPLEELVTSAAGQLRYRFKALVTNGTGRFRFAALTATLHAGEAESSAALTGGHDDGQTQTYVFDIPFSRSGDYCLTIRIADRSSPGVPLAVRSTNLHLAYSPIQLVLKRPFYRNTIYATENLEAVEADVELRLPAARLTDGVRLAAELHPVDRDTGPPLARGSATTGSGNAALTVPVPALADGTYRLAVTATLADGESFRAEARIRKVPPSPDEWRVDENLVLLHNGAPFLPYGWFSASADDAAMLVGEGVTAIQNYSAQWYPPEKTLGWLDQLQEHGLYGCFYPWPSNEFMQNFRQPVSDAEEAALRERIRAFRDHPGLFAYYMWDEPELRPLLVQRAERLYEIVAEEDPYHPCIMLNDTIPGIHKYRNGGDILMPDPYPLFNKGGLAGRPIEYTSKFMKACREASVGRKAWWVTPQAFDYFHNKENSRPPTFVELRNQQLQAVINGSRGILWYTYGQRYNYEDLDVGVPFLGREIRRLTHAVLAQEQPDALTWEADERDHIQACVRRVGGYLYVFTVSTRTAPQNATFTLAGADMDTLWVVSEARRVNVKSGCFTDRFELYEGHVYTTDQTAAQGQTVRDIQDRIEAAKAQRHRPGNLAYRGLGTTVTVSSRNRYSGMLSMVIDGKRKGKGWADDTWKTWPDWLQVGFPDPVTVGKVVVYTKSIADYEILLEQDGQMVRAASGTRSEGQPIEAVFTPRPATAVRVVANSGPGTRSAVTEIEVYGE